MINDIMIDTPKLYMSVEQFSNFKYWKIMINKEPDAIPSRTDKFEWWLSNGPVYREFYGSLIANCYGNYVRDS